ncbi:hypothetical protein [Caudoviricetes sp.]|nr:hypothetical protein [Caudoviricetes sp.]
MILVIAETRKRSKLYTSYDLDVYWVAESYKNKSHSVPVEQCGLCSAVWLHQVKLLFSYFFFDMCRTILV